MKKILKFYSKNWFDVNVLISLVFFLIGILVASVGVVEENRVELLIAAACFIAALLFFLMARTDNPFVKGFKDPTKTKEEKIKERFRNPEHALYTLTRLQDVEKEISRLEELYEESLEADEPSFTDIVGKPSPDLNLQDAFAHKDRINRVSARFITHFSEGATDARYIPEAYLVMNVKPAEYWMKLSNYCREISIYLENKDRKKIEELKEEEKNLKAILLLK
jgi:hypothetical protein